jgi:hypothetical protein
MQSIQPDREREEELRLYLEWKTAKTGRRQEAALFGLWQACRLATKAVVKRLAERLGSKKNKHITVPAWLRMHGLTLDEAHAEAFPAVYQAAKRFKPKKGNGIIYLTKR